MTEAQAVLVLRNRMAGPSWTFDAMRTLRDDYGWPPSAVAAIRGQFP